MLGEMGLAGKRSELGLSAYRDTELTKVLAQRKPLSDSYPAFFLLIATTSNKNF